MKQLFLAVALLIGISAQAQTINRTRPVTAKKTTVKKTKTTTVRKHEHYTSRNGKITARSLGKYELPDTVIKAEGEASHVNANYNESMPPLSPNSGSSAPIGK